MLDPDHFSPDPKDLALGSSFRLYRRPLPQLWAALLFVVATLGILQFSMSFTTMFDAFSVSDDPNNGGRHYGVYVFVPSNQSKGQRNPYSFLHLCRIPMVRDGWVDCCSVFRDFCGLFSGNEMGSQDVGLLHRHG